MISLRRKTVRKKNTINRKLLMLFVHHWSYADDGSSVNIAGIEEQATELSRCQSTAARAAMHHSTSKKFSLSLVPECPVSMALEASKSPLLAVERTKKSVPLPSPSPDPNPPHPPKQAESPGPTLIIKGVPMTYVLGSSSSADSEFDEEEDPQAVYRENSSTAFPSHGDVIHVTPPEKDSSGGIWDEPSMVMLKKVLPSLLSTAGPSSSFSYRLTVLGYSESHNCAYLLPEPALHIVKASPDVKHFEPLPLVAIHHIALLGRSNELFSLGGSSSPCMRSWGLAVPEPIIGVRLPTTPPGAPHPLQSPPLDEELLFRVFKVNTHQPYFLKRVNRYVMFLGVSCGMPWVESSLLQQPTESSREAPSKVGAIPTSPAAPLSQCYSEKDLLDLYGLCDARDPLVGMLSPLSLTTAKAEPFVSPVSRGGDKVSRGSSMPSGTGTPRSYTPRRECILGHRTTSPRPPAYSTPTPQSSVVSVVGPWGNPINCQRDAVAAYGVKFPDRLVGKEDVADAMWKQVLRAGSSKQSESISYAGRIATVMGLYRGKLVLLFDGDQKATIFKDKTTREAVESLFTRLHETDMPSRRESVGSEMVVPKKSFVSNSGFPPLSRGKKLDYYEANSSAGASSGREEEAEETGNAKKEPSSSQTTHSSIENASEDLPKDIQKEVEDDTFAVYTRKEVTATETETNTEGSPYSALASQSPISFGSTMKADGDTNDSVCIEKDCMGEAGSESGSAVALQDLVNVEEATKQAAAPSFSSANQFHFSSHAAVSLNGSSPQKITKSVATSTSLPSYQGTPLLNFLTAYGSLQLSIRNSAENQRSFTVSDVQLLYMENVSDLWAAHSMYKRCFHEGLDSFLTTSSADEIMDYLARNHLC